MVTFVEDIDSIRAFPVSDTKYIDLLRLNDDSKFKVMRFPTPPVYLWNDLLIIDFICLLASVLI